MRINEINWGDDSAERDENLLNYFFESQAFARLKRFEKALVIGRKGSGKSAVRKKLENTFHAQPKTHVINLSPKLNSIRSILNDGDICGGFGEEIFFQHTWIRQILLDCLCTIGHCAKGAYVTGSLKFARELAEALCRTSKDIVENISEVLVKTKAKVGELGEFGLSIERELRAVAEVDSLEHHVRELTKDGERFIVLIDDLDLGWNNGDTANNLLLGLLSASNYLASNFPKVHICVFLREDVYEILITKTQHSDKYRNVERLRWERDALMSILASRINFNRIRNGGERHINAFYTVFPQTIGASNTENWLFERTLGRPRELIQFARSYTEDLDGEDPSDEVLKRSELVYSNWKLADLGAEFSNQYPGLDVVFAYWKSEFFRYKYHLKRSEIDEMLLAVLSDVDLCHDWFVSLASRTDVAGLLGIFFEIGFIGDYVQGGEGGSKTVYSNHGPHEPRFEEVQIHPCFRKAVGTVERIRSKAALSADGDVP